jgi:HEAT repeat protein
LLKADPASAPPETKKKVARAFKIVAEDDSSFDHDKAIKGLVQWAGTYSVPVLLKMLNNGRLGDQETVLRALAELQDPRAVPVLVKMLGGATQASNEELIVKTLIVFKDPRAINVLAARITDIRSGPLACQGLRDIGSAAEDAVIAVGDTTKPRTCVTALEILGDIGTEKSFELLARAQASRDRNLRAAAMSAKATINRRRLAAKAKANGD